MKKYQMIINKITMKYRNLSEKMIIKDLLIDEIIKELSMIFNVLINKGLKFDWLLVGGTSLSKSYKEIKRISEDIDISILCESKEYTKKVMKEILNYFLILDNDKMLPFNIIDKDVISTNQTFNFKNFKIHYKGYEFDIDFKSLINNNYYSPNHRKIMNVSHKILKLNQSEEIIIKVPDFKYIIAEKFLAYQKMKVKNTNNIRTWRHIFDIYSIFTEQLLENNIKNWKEINNIYNFIIDQYERTQLEKDIKK
ncbi:nucleotidyl transferase AbiEii/AbiGii toxin family protein [Malacoplasma iowae]|uniref:nucleotidyl transferase AbiEii/AbiGii toxin family protein n=1 Tax=Malacoplasma iowae TaxID=2116 RepID=UPI002A18B81B|nr:nucleotidyl transferase AbiEii/AbiGii toxin family protein [Malacoplasma iowae]WPL37907.1 nucleotidyl transferase AbiEii/AbiGii toxin family protein [Malacoplasma iowae]